MISIIRRPGAEQSWHPGGQKSAGCRPDVTLESSTYIGYPPGPAGDAGSRTAETQLRGPRQAKS